MVSAVILYRLGGWWYGKRLVFCGATDPSPRLVRRVYVFAALVWALPALLLALWSMSKYPTPRDACLGNDIFWTPLLFLAWSVITSHRGATASFALRKSSACIWFLALPLLTYAALITGLGGWLGSQGAHIAPDVSHPRRIQRAAFSVAYPGNWFVDPKAQAFDPDHCFAIEPPYADCAVFLEIRDDWGDPKEAVAACQETLGSGFRVHEWIDVDRWGPHRGAGCCALGRLEDDRYTLRVFAMEDDDGGNVMVVREVCSEPVAKAMEPGLQLIRASFAWKR